MATNTENESTVSREVEKPPIEPIRLPSVEEIRGQDIWNNCAVRSVVSGVMGMAKVLSFPSFFGFSHMGLSFFPLFYVRFLRKRGKVMFFFVSCLELDCCGFQNV